MRASLTTLGYISSFLSAGRPIWALLLLNEQQGLPSHLIKAVTTKAALLLEESSLSPVLVEALIRGRSLSEFSAIDQQTLKDRDRTQQRAASRQVITAPPPIPPYKRKIAGGSLRRAAIG